METKVCTKCKVEKSVSEFEPRPSRGGQLRTHCRECRKNDARKWGEANRDKQRKNSRSSYERNREAEIERVKQFHRKNPNYQREWHLKTTFGITLEQYLTLLNDGNGACWSCGAQETAKDGRTGVVRNLHVDHDHTTGAVRGLLCTKCNLALGYLDDNLEKIEALKMYLTRASTLC